MHTIPRYAFAHTGIESIDLPSALQGIDVGLFYRATQLRFVRIHRNQGDITVLKNSNAFAGTTNLRIMAPNLERVILYQNNTVWWNSGVNFGVHG